MTMPITLITDIVEVQFYISQAGPVLTGAIELFSPANKDRPASRDAFVFKCASYVQQGIGLIIVDIVTDRRADLHTDLLRRLNDSIPLPNSADLWAASYRPWQEDQQTNMQICHHPLAVGAPLPAIPFWLKRGPHVEIDVEANYQHPGRAARR